MKDTTYLFIIIRATSGDIPTHMALAQNEGCATTIVRSAHAEHGTLTYGRW